LSQTPSQPAWVPLEMLRARLEANIQALRARDPKLSSELQSHQSSQIYCIQTAADNLVLGVRSGQWMRALPQTVPPPRAAQIAAQIYPQGRYNKSLFMAGEDLGWLLNRIYQLPNDSYQTHQWPLYLVMRELERFWIILHIHDWRTLLADARVRLFVGNDAPSRFRKSLSEDVLSAWPANFVVADPTSWPEGESAGQLLQAAAEDLEKKQNRLKQQTQVIFADRTPASFLDKLKSGHPLKVMGVCTRHSVFVRYSMRDWLEAFERLGHRTHLVTESADYQLVNSTAVSQAVVDFKPDLVVMINHFRKEMGVVPDQVPFVMWAQDWCDNITCSAAGDAQGAMDYVLGQNPMRMAHAHGYPIDRYLPAVVAVNDARFQSRALTTAELAEFGCDISIVSNAGVPARALLDDEIRRIGSAEFGAVLNSIYAELESVYQNGGSITQVGGIIPILVQHLKTAGIVLAREQFLALVDLFSHGINSALFRHQALQWVADLGVDLRIYGRGWDRHPTLAKYARGVADNMSQLSLIYQASKINLQISPHGVMHQRVMEGLAARGFFLFRTCAGDTVGRHYKAVWEWCDANRFGDDETLRQRAPQAIQTHLAEIARLLNRDPFDKRTFGFVPYIQFQAKHGYLESADLLWGDDEQAVSFDSAAQLGDKVRYFLTNPAERARRIESMRRPVVDRYTYLATVRRLLDFVAADMAGQAQAKTAA
jgi:hypothetical protein